MFPKTILTALAIGALSVNALTVPVARSPAPEPESWDQDSSDAYKREPEPLVVPWKPLALGAATGLGLLAGHFAANKADQPAQPAQRREPESEDSVVLLAREPEPLVLPWKQIGLGAAGAVGLLAGHFASNAAQPPAQKREPEPEPLRLPSLSTIGNLANAGLTGITLGSMFKREPDADDSAVVLLSREPEPLVLPWKQIGLGAAGAAGLLAGHFASNAAQPPAQRREPEPEPLRLPSLSTIGNLANAGLTGITLGSMFKREPEPIMANPFDPNFSARLSNGAYMPSQRLPFKREPEADDSAVVLLSREPEPLVLPWKQIGLGAAGAAGLLAGHFASNAAQPPAQKREPEPVITMPSSQTLSHLLHAGMTGLTLGTTFLKRQPEPLRYMQPLGNGGFQNHPPAFTYPLV